MIETRNKMRVLNNKKREIMNSITRKKNVKNVKNPRTAIRTAVLMIIIAHGMSVREYESLNIDKKYEKNLIELDSQITNSKKR